MGRVGEKGAPKTAVDVDWAAKVVEAHAAIDAAAESERELGHPVEQLYALFSGGHDSLTAVHVSASHPLFKGVVHINTGIGVQETRQFVRDTCARQGWPLLEYHPPAGYRYRDLVLEHGFPGPAGHTFMYRALKERSVRQLIKDVKGPRRFERILLATGVRSQESLRRMRQADVVQRDGAQLWVAPIYDWSKADCNAYIAAMGLARNEVVDTMHMSCECMCGSFSKPDEMAELELWYPETAAEIKGLEQEVAARGHKACVWGKRPPKISEAELAQQRIDTSLPLCTACVTDRLLAESAE